MQTFSQQQFSNFFLGSFYTLKLLKIPKSFSLCGVVSIEIYCQIKQNFKKLLIHLNITVINSFHVNINNQELTIFPQTSDKSGIVLYFKSLFKVCVNTAGFSYTSAFNLMLFLLKYMKKIWPHTDILVGKRIY